MQYLYTYFIQKFTDAFKLSRVYPSNLIFCAQKFTESTSNRSKTSSSSITYT